ncbi:MAG: hypothetical protein KIT79_00750 [Deltaproteobacteria bacterium]|nr:hypothetical protein [Deltaproteobacteria bacterium]
MSEGGEYQVAKRSVPVMVRLTNGNAHKGDFLLAAQAEQHHGAERVKDLLNGSGEMVPLFSHLHNTPILLNKRHIEMVELTEPDLASDADRDTDFAIHRQALLIMDSGSKLRGDLVVTMPSGHDRTLDFLNRGERFVYLESRDGTKIINLLHVIAVEDAKGH